jgi:hypothetical protein
MMSNERKSKDMNITPLTTIYDMLEIYPGLEEKLIEIAPVFNKLKNPVLRRTITRITTLKQASVVGGIEIGILVNNLREAAGLSKMNISKEEHVSSTAPGWINNSVKTIFYDARTDLQNGIHPLGKVMREINLLEKKQVYILITPFVPAPLIEKIKEKGFEIWTEDLNGEVKTYIRKSDT